MTRPPTPASSAHGYSTTEVARILDVAESTVRSFVHAGFLSPRRDRRGAFRYSFQDLVVLRAAQSLRRQRIPAQRIRRALTRLVEQLPRGRSLAAVAISAEGGAVVVRTGGEAWEPTTGQRRLDFSVSELAEKAAPLASRAVAATEDRPGVDAEDWWELGLELEASAPREAAEAYRRALEIDPSLGDAHLNLGRLLHEEGRLLEAESHYRRALDLAPEDPTTAFNLGVALQDLGRSAAATAAYRRALAVDPYYADAHYNLAGLFEEQGEAGAALRHLARYRRLTRGE